MAFRTEINIPVIKDPRTFEQRRNDMMTKLERSYKTITSTTSTESNVDKANETSDKSESHCKNRTLSNTSWDSQRNKWIEGARKRFDIDVENMRNDMFSLEPLDEFDLDNWENFGGLSTFDNNGADSMMDQMERRMQIMRQQMDSSMRGVGGPSNINQSGSQHVSSHFSSSTTKTVSDGGTVTQSSSNTQETRQNHNGVSTGSKSHSASTNMSKSGCGVNEMPGDRQIGVGAVGPTPQSPIRGVMDFLTNAFEVGEDGLVHFKIRFDAKDFSPEDIEVNTEGNRLTVHAKKSFKSSETTGSREFSRTVDLPRSIDHGKFNCCLTEDGVLILDAPVTTPDYASITFDSSHNLGIRPKDANLINENDVCVSIRDQSGPLVLNDGLGGRKLHLEVPIEEGYKADDLCVRMDANKICVTGKRDKTSVKHLDAQNQIADCKSSEIEEFTRSFEVPETIDPFTVSSMLKNRILVIEAPLLCTV